MSENDIIDTIAEVLNTQLGSYPDRYAEWIDVQALVAVLRAAGYAIVKLPEREQGAWPVDYPRQHATGWVYITATGAIGFPPHKVLPSQARSLAAALLAAADKADQSGEPSGLDEFHPDTTHWTQEDCR